MIRASARDRKGPKVLVGLSLGNVERLLADEPICFPLREMELGRGFDDCWLIITAAYEDGFSVPEMPEDATDSDQAIVVCIGKDWLTDMRDYDRILVVQSVVRTLKGKNLRVLIVTGDEDELEEELRGGIGPGTKVTTKGYGPSKIRQEERN